MKSILVHDYEQFFSRPKETMTHTYNIYSALMNDLLLVDKIYA